jgi:signal transduction histidine kinase/ActR/RegA family two-component response regulator
MPAAETSHAALMNQLRRTAMFTAIILAAVIPFDYLFSGVLFIAPGQEYTPILTIAITLLVAPPFCFFLIRQGARLEAVQASLAEERARRLADVEAARDAAEAATRTKSEFLANMSHEIRTPLNGVLGMTQALAGRDLDPAVREMVSTIRESGATLMAILNDVLDLSKIEAGRLDIAPGDASLTHTLRQVMRLFEPVAGEKGVTLALASGASSDHQLKFDALRVRQCVSNLVSNAVKFTPQGHISIEASVTPEGQRHRVEVRVIDSGIGMDEATLDRLFEAFTQADGSTTRRFGGTGLGLTISRQLARLMGGDITVTSQLGRGSTFTLSFLADAADAVNANQPAADAPRRSEVRLRGARVLLTDDNAVNRQVVRLFLQPQGAIIVEAANGAEALRALETQPFDLVLLDVHMPVMDGVETIKRIRASAETWRALPVIALTADAMSGDRERLLALGMTGYVAKPIEQAELLSAIGLALGAVAPTTAAPTAPVTPDDSGVNLDDLLADLDRLAS